jgi:hypothetical protein
LDPRSELRNNGELSHYGEINFNSGQKDQLGKVPEYIDKLVRHWPEESRCLPISGGLDSRLVVTGNRFEYGYTYGPEDSGDRPIARQFADHFNRYNEYEFHVCGTLEEEKPLLDSFFYGVSDWMPQLLSSYHYSFSSANGAYAMFDGFQGDVLQRANHLKFGGALGSVLKLFPWLYKLGFSARFLMNNRNKAMSDESFEFMMADYEKRTAHLQADTYQKIVYYEFIYGRGARYVVNGGNITAGQMYTTIPVFLLQPIFDMMVSQNFADTVHYKQISKIWSEVPMRYRELDSDAGVGPMTPYWLTPFKNIFVRILTHYVPGYGNYAMGKAKTSK